VQGRPLLLRFVGLALLVHAAVAIAMIRARSQHPVAAESCETELGVELEPAAPPPSPAAEETAAEETAAANPPAEMPAASRSHEAPAASAAPAIAEPPGPVVTAPADSTGGWTLSPFTSQGTPHPGGAAPAGSAFDEAVRAGVRATVAESVKKRDASKRLLGGDSPHEVELGLFPGGEFVGYTRDGVRSSRAPNVGHATFEITIDGGGNLTAVRILDASSNRFEWDEAAEEIMKAAHGHQTRVPSGSQGLVLTLEVSSDIRTVSGRPPPTTTLGRITGAIGDPLDTLVDDTVPLQRVISAHVVDVTVL